MNLLKGIKWLCNFTKEMALDQKGQFWAGAAGPIIGGLLGGLGGLFGGGKDERTTQTTMQAPFSWSAYPPQAQPGMQQLSTSLFGAPSATPQSYIEWHRQSYQSYPDEKNREEQENRRALYDTYLTNFYEGVTYGPSATQEIVEGALPYYQQFLEEQLPTALAPYEQFLGTTPEAEWQIIRGDLGSQQRESELAQRAYAAQYGTEGANLQAWGNIQNRYLGDLAQQRRLLEAGWGERQMAAGAGYAGLAGMGPQTASAMASLQMMPYDYQQQFLSSMSGLQSQGGITTQTSPQYTPNIFENILGGAMQGGTLYNQYQQNQMMQDYLNNRQQSTQFPSYIT